MRATADRTGKIDAKKSWIPAAPACRANIAELQTRCRVQKLAGVLNDRTAFDSKRPPGSSVWLDIVGIADGSKVRRGDLRYQTARQRHSKADQRQPQKARDRHQPGSRGKALAARKSRKTDTTKRASVRENIIPFPAQSAFGYGPASSPQRTARKRLPNAYPPAKNICTPTHNRFEFSQAISAKVVRAPRWLPPDLCLDPDDTCRHMLFCRRDLHLNMIESSMCRMVHAARSPPVLGRTAALAPIG